ncbi:ribose 5-phosphate isomerase B [Iocasia frigidifontis]|uniref:Ribose 5-phosphate isomerase B n=1 Tax=Iocasia fonsfrigidae TaxID=2682810 RepID=A0A8A7KCU3_9FIRM|nr:MULTISPECIES: ribose 5-phosphate isomerase B [Halanaerobiaceae]AZO93757.1 ribose 5-phosphate isomerase B [Halocella sp. SP3-1]MTI58984.1 ribose 5-phosphate isomerase B [Bacillota bacterium]QTL96697.1 ribose 5-phosphate isomerase B [Iocasia fonsfrigidae]
MIAIGSDHAAFEFKNKIKKYLAGKGIECKDYGCDDTNRTDYPIYGEAVARAVTKGECERGIVCCGTGVGISLAANKVKGIRAVVCSEVYTAKLSRAHNNTNILSLGSRVVTIERAKMIIDAWLNTEYEGGRHEKRIKMISKIEDKN